MKLFIALITMTLLATGSSAFADGHGNDHGGHHGGGHHPSPGPHHPPHDQGDGFSMGILLGLTSADITSQANDYPEYKMAIIQGEDAALEVLQGGNASDLFYNAKAATEGLYNVEFGSEEEAAIAVLKLNQLFSQE
jgi:hypothetical protein